MDVLLSIFSYVKLVIIQWPKREGFLKNGFFCYIMWYGTRGKKRNIIEAVDLSDESEEEDHWPKAQEDFEQYGYDKPNIQVRGPMERGRRAKNANDGNKEKGAGRGISRYVKQHGQTL